MVRMRVFLIVSKNVLKQLISSTAYDLEIKEAIHILWQNPTLDTQVNILTPSFHSKRPLFISTSFLLLSYRLS